MLKALLGGLFRRPPPADSAHPVGEQVEAALRRVLPEVLGLGDGDARPPDYARIGRIVAAVEAAQYAADRMQGASAVRTRGELLELALAAAPAQGLVLELGVYRGDSLRFIARRVTGPVHGFDSFQGLPEDWTPTQKKGRFSLGGELPHFDEPNVELHVGLFGDTLPGFLATHLGPVRLAHIDCDLYASTAEVLRLLRPRLVPGSVIVFDEYLNFPGWRQHEHRAFQEFVARERVQYRYIGFATSFMSVAVVIG